MHGVSKMKNYTVEEFKINDLDSVVSLHQAAFRDFFLTSLGSGFLKVYYKLVSRPDIGAILIARSSSGDVSGFAATVFNAKKFYRELNGLKFRILLSLTYTLLKNPGKIFQIIVRFLSVKIRGDSKSFDQFELVSIAVDPKVKNSGIGKLLISETIELVCLKGGGQLSLRTDSTENDPVISFYIRNGFSVVNSEKIGRREMWVFRKFVESRSGVGE